MRVATFLFLILALSICASNQSRADQCAGSLKQPHPHPYGNFNFETYSLYDSAPKLTDGGVDQSSNYKFGIVTCVMNPDPTNFLYVHWLIPGPNGWVPPKDGILRSVVRLTNETSPAPEDGCLEYGNRGDTDFAKFHATKEDSESLDDEKRRGCRAVIANPKQTSSVLKAIENFVLKFVNYVPSDGKNPQKTMLQIEGTVGLKGGFGQYVSYMNYKVTRPAGSEGSISDIRLRPQFRGNAERLLPAFEKVIGTTLQVKSEDNFFVPVTGIENPTLTYASYVILDKNNAAVGAINFPVFVPVTN